MVFKKVFVLFLCCTTAAAGTKISPLQQVEAEQTQTESELDKWAFPAAMGIAICFLLLWSHRAQKAVGNKPKPPAQPSAPKAEPLAPKAQPIQNPAPHNPPAVKAEITYRAIDPMEVGELLKEVTKIYTAQRVHEESWSKFTLPFTELDKKELCQHSLSTIELPSTWDSGVAEIAIVANRRTPGKHSYTIFSTVQDVRNAQPVKDFFAVVEPGIA